MAEEGESTRIALFKGKEIRKTICDGQWWFSVSDVVEVLTGTKNATDYIKKVRKRDEELAKGWGQIVSPLKLETSGGIQKQKDYAILTAEISKAAFGVTPSEYKKIKGLKRQNLRDHMNDLELIFSMLGEAATTEITRNRDTQGFDENKQAAVEGGSVAGKARKELEVKSGKKVVSGENYLPGKNVKKLKNKHLD